MENVIYDGYNKINARMTVDDLVKILQPYGKKLIKIQEDEYLDDIEIIKTMHDEDEDAEVLVIQIHS